MELPIRPRPESMRIQMFDPDHCNQCGVLLDTGAFFCSDNCVIESWKIVHAMRDT